MGINIQEIIELEDCSEFAIKKRNEETKRALFQYGHGMPNLDPEEIISRLLPRLQQLKTFEALEKLLISMDDAKYGKED
jgi:hypothetical protein